MTRRLCILLLAAGLLAAFALFVRSTWLARENFVPDPPSPLLASTPICPGHTSLRTVSFPAAGAGQISGWYSRSTNGAAVLILHGTNTDRASMLGEVCILSDAGFGVLAYDSPGEGSSQGRIRWGETERSVVVAAVDWLSRQPDVDGRRIGAYGFSMGGLVLACAAAPETRIRAVVLAATPESLRTQQHRENHHWGLVGAAATELAMLLERGTLADEPRPADCVAQIAPRPLLLLRGSDDPVVPASATELLYRRAHEPRQLEIIQGAGHGGYTRAQPQEYPQLIQAFFHRTLLAPLDTGQRPPTMDQVPAAAAP